MHCRRVVNRRCFGHGLDRAYFIGLLGIEGHVAGESQLHRGGCGLVTAGAPVAVTSRAAIATFGPLAAAGAMRRGFRLVIGLRLRR